MLAVSRQALYAWPCMWFGEVDIGDVLLRYHLQIGHLAQLTSRWIRSRTCPKFHSSLRFGVEALGGMIT